MWVIVITTLLAASLPHHDFVNPYLRVSFGWLIIGIYDVCLAFGFFWAMVRGQSYLAKYPSSRTHPVLIWLLVLFAVGSLCGIVGSLNSSLPIKWVLSEAREYMAIPICIVMGYRLLATPRSCVTYAYLSIVAGIITAIGVFAYFNHQLQTVQVTGSIGYLRNTINQFSPEYASCAGMLLLWSLAARRRMFNALISLVLMLICFVGYLAMVSRTNVIVMLGSAILLLFIIPKGRRLISTVRLVALGPVIFLTLFGALMLGGRLVGRADFVNKIMNHFATLLPSERKIGEAKAWDTRVGSIQQEFDMWLENPLLGNGFRSQEAKAFSGEMAFTGAYNHNGWTSVLAQTGIFGFAAVVLMLGTMIVLGYRMVKDDVDRTSVLIGAVAYITGVVTMLRASCTMVWVSRTAFHFAVVCGIIIRAREMQQTTRERQLAASYGYEPQIDTQTGMLLPDYQLPEFRGMGGFGSVN